MISFSDTLLLSSTILNSNEKETQTSNDLIEKKAFRQIFQMNILPVWKKAILKSMRSCILYKQKMKCRK